MAANAMRAVRIHEHGDASKLAVDSVEVADPAAGEVRVRILCAGVNFIDIYQREGLYPMSLPAIMGNEAAGIADAVGQDVAGISPGDAVAFCGSGGGAYAEQINVAAGKLVALPEGMDSDVAGAIMLKGLTAEYLARRCWPIRAGDPVVVTAAAGGVGRLLCQWLAQLGAEVIGVVGSEGKAAAAREADCAHVLAGYGDLAKRVREICPDGAWAVYDSVGADTFASGLGALRPRGCLITYGNASGPAPAFKPLDLASRGSLFVTRPVLNHYITKPSELRSAAAALFGQVERGLRLPPIKHWPLAEAADAQQALQGRKLEGIAALRPQA